MIDEGYDFVPLPDDVRRAARPEARHDKKLASAITATLSLTLVTEQPLHVGSGFKTLRDGVVARSAVTSNGVACVPGSTLKGVLRSRFEAITRSCALFRENDKPARVRSSSFPGAKARFTSTVANRSVFRPCASDACCAACALFGRMSLRSRVAVSDCVAANDLQFAIAEVAEMYGPNLHHVGPFEPKHDRGETMLEVKGLHGRKFARGRGPETEAREHIEVVPKGSVLVGTLRIVNVTDAEFGGLLAALGVQPGSRLKVGGGKGHGFGRVRVETPTITSRAPSAPIGDWTHYEQAFRAHADAWPEGVDALVRIHEEQSRP